MLDDFGDPVGPYDYPPRREIDLGNGNKIYLKKTDPFGFFKFNLERGQLPSWIQGEYTSITEAEKALDKYLKDRDLTESKEVITKKGK